MSILRSVTRPPGWRATILFIAGAVICFHLAYSDTHFGPFRLLIFGYVVCLTQLSLLKTTRRSFYAGLVTGLLCVAPQLTCFWEIFGPAAIVLWIILGLWIAAFTGITHAALARFGPIGTAALVPFVWMGLEYFRSELYYLKFSWLNVGYAFSDWQIFSFHFFGMYGIGFLAALCASFFLVARPLYATAGAAALITLIAFATPAGHDSQKKATIRIAGVQLEFPSEREIPPALDSLAAQYPTANLFVLSEYTVDGPVSAALKDWCRTHHHYLVVGGKDPAPNNNYYNCAFVVNPDGEVVFRQVKSVPIQFFKDGLPAPEQTIWSSPWGKIGFCICYDLSYTRVVDGLVKKGAQLLVVPTMDVVDWGERQHRLHALVAPVRAAEYHIPIFRLASSGISQAVDADGRVMTTAPFAGEGKSLFATFDSQANSSLPMDRFLAPLASCLTGILVVALSVRKHKRADHTPADKREHATSLEDTSNPSDK